MHTRQVRGEQDMLETAMVEIVQAYIDGRLSQKQACAALDDARHFTTGNVRVLRTVSGKRATK